MRGELLTLATEMCSLATEIVREHDAVCQAVQSGVAHAKRAGELLLEAKAGVEHGAWLPWLAEHCPTIPERTAQAYMRIAREWPTLEAKAPRVADLPMRQALALLADRTVDAAAPDDAGLPQHHRLSVDLLQFRRLLAAEEQEAQDVWAEMQMLMRALEAPDLTAEDAAAIHRRGEAILGVWSERNIRSLAEIGRILNECEALGWADLMRELLAHPEAIAGFRLMCQARIDELEAEAV